MALQGHLATDCKEPVHVAVVIKLVPLSAPKKLSFIQACSIKQSYSVHSLLDHVPSLPCIVPMIAAWLSDFR